jgi:hypothetical protein
MPVVVELFTAEGCSSCPPADALLAALARLDDKKIEIIALGEHVDYWNDTGWVDRFSSPAFTQRQRDYGLRFGLDAPYTPQMVIDGRIQVSGNNKAGVSHDIESAASEAKPARVTLQWDSPTRLRVAVHASGNSAGQIFLAITEDGLTTNVGKGENQGRTLRHDRVVRQLRQLGTVSKGEFATNVEVSPKPDWNANQLKLAVWVQEKHQGPILGAASTNYPSQPGTGR